MASKSYQKNLEYVNFLKRTEQYKQNLTMLKENILDVIRLHDRKENPMSFEEIAEELGLSSRHAAYNIYQSNIKDIDEIKKYKIK